MLSPLIESLIRFRRYQSLFILSCGVFITFILISFIFITAKTKAMSYIETLHLKFVAENAIVEEEIIERESIFQILLVGAEVRLSEDVFINKSSLFQYHANEQEIFFEPTSTSVSQWIYSPEDFVVNEMLARYFWGLSAYIGRVISKDGRMKSIILSSYLYSVEHEIITVVPAPDLATREKIKSNKNYLGLLTKDIDKHVFKREYIANDNLNRLHWMPLYINPYSGKKTLRLAAPIMMNGIPLAIFVMEFSPHSLMSNFIQKEAKGTYTLVSKDGGIISEYGVKHTGYSNIERLSLEKFVKNDEGKYAVQYQTGGITFVENLRHTDWFLVYHYSWYEIVSVIAHEMIGDALITIGVLLLVWILLIYCKHHVFRPLFKQSQQVFESEQLSRTVIETAPVGLGFLTVENGEPLLRSPVMVQIQQHLQSGGYNLPAELAHSYRQKIKSQESRVVKQELTFDIDNGQSISLSISMAPVHYRGQNALVVAFVDITKNKQLEQQLMAARETADRANAAKSAFLAAMSHEIRTPLNAIIGNLELLTRTALDTQRDRLGIIRHASDNLMATISDVLDFSKIEAGELYLEQIEFDVLAVATHALEIFAPLARAKGLTLAGELGETVTQPMVGDPTFLAQVLNNLLSNALKFTERGGIWLRIRVDSVAGQISFELEDTGIGMSPSQQLQVFNAFSQADETINRRYGGTGLGLTLCKRLTEAMGGTLSVASELNKGSVFQLLLPLRAQDIDGADFPRFNGERVTVLAVLPPCRAYLSKVLTGWGLVVDTYQHPAQIDDTALASLNILLLWGDRVTWHPEDENRLVEEAGWVIDCSSEGPVIPSATGRILTSSIYGLKGLSCALRYILQGQSLPLSEQGEQVLPCLLRVLVAEDNPVNRRLLEEQLQLLGCTVRLAEGGEQALAYLQQERFDILLTDLSMPGMDGYALAQRVHIEWPEMPVVAVTANATQQDYVKCEAAGMSRVLTKPLLLGKLKEVLREVCGLDIGNALVLSATKEEKSALLGGNSLPQDMWYILEDFFLSSFVTLRRALIIGDIAGILHELHMIRGALGVYRFPDAERKLANIELRLKSGESNIEELLEQFMRVLQYEFSTQRADIISMHENRELSLND